MFRFSLAIFVLVSFTFTQQVNIQLNINTSPEKAIAILKAINSILQDSNKVQITVSNNPSPIISKTIVAELPVSNSKSSEPVLININTTTAKELCTLKGIGPTMAKRIIEYRKTKKRFAFKSQILSIKGMGKKKFAKIKNQIVVK